MAGPAALTVIGSGGLRSGIDVAKALALGADLAGLAYQLLEAATQSPARVIERLGRIVQELRICMFCIGAKTIKDLQEAKLTKRSGI